jgi:hypothetical protein
VLFALLARPENLGRTVRELAAASGTSIQSVSNTLAALRDEGHIVRTARTGHSWVGDKPHALIDRFAEAWKVFLRASLVDVMLESSQTPEHLEPAIAALLEREGIAFGFGGTAGAERIQPWYRGSRTVVHIRGSWKTAWNRVLRVAPTGRDGSVIVIRTMGDEDLVGDASHAHPLLLYADMLASADPREWESAERLLPRVLRTSETHVQSVG